jgi:predicted transcriptional regulator
LADEQQTDLIALTTEIATAYGGANSISATDLPGLLKSIHDALKGAASGSEAKPVEEPKAPAVPIRRSITRDYLICLEDGRRFKSLKRHLRTKWNLSPEAYRAKWGLPNDYPMVAANYSAARSALAMSIGLGQGGRKKGAAKLARPAVGKPTRPKVKA